MMPKELTIVFFSQARYSSQNLSSSVYKFLMCSKPSKFTSSVESNAYLDEDFGSIGKSSWHEAFSDPIQVPIGPVTRARAKKFKDALSGLIQATWSQAIAWRPIEGITCDNQPNKCMIQVLEGTK